MVIGVNTRFLLDGHLEGIGWFTYETLKRIVLSHPEHKFIFFFDRSYDEKFIFADNVKGVVIGPPTRHPLLWYIWFEWRLPYQLEKHKVQAFLSPDGFASLNTKVPTLTVVHDIAFEHDAFGVYRSAMWFYRHFTPKYVRHANRVATVSEFSKKDIVDHYQISPDRIDVVYDGANESFVPLKENEKLRVREEYSDGKPYFIYVGAIHPRKNVLRLLQAFEQYKEQSGSNKKLMIVGRKAWSNNDLDQYLQEMKHRSDVIFMGSLDQSKLNKVIGAAYAMTYVSVFEGFGIPILEAMYCHVPSICSNTTSIPEVAGGAGLQVDPESVENITEAMLKMEDKQFRLQLVNNCKAQKEKYSWDLTAQKLWDSLMATCEI